LGKKKSPGKGGTDEVEPWNLAAAKISKKSVRLRKASTREPARPGVEESGRTRGVRRRYIERYPLADEKGQEFRTPFGEQKEQNSKKPAIKGVKGSKKE